MPADHVILGSRSPRRLELLQLLVPREQIRVLPPRSAAEAGFDGLTELPQIELRLHDIVSAKRHDVRAQLSDRDEDHGLILVADTIVLVREPDGTPAVLGQPPDVGGEEVVRDWFRRYYSGQAHQVWTGVSLGPPAGPETWSCVTSTVMFRHTTEEEIDWYLSTGESQGKAGGYALQGLASVFVENVQGSLTNVVGLPLEVLVSWLEPLSD